MNAFQLIPQLISKLSDVLSCYKTQNAQGLLLLDDIILGVERLIASQADTTLAAIHLIKEHSPLKQSIYCALLAKLMADKLKYTQNKTQTLLRACLTANFSFMDTQVLLNANDTELTPALVERVQQHPQQSVNLLKQSGITDDDWLSIILQHHERQDGKGYPNEIRDDQIREEAMILSLCEFYTSMIDYRAYRKAMQPKEVLMAINKQHHERPEHLNTSFIRLIGIFPPGSFVVLMNREIGLVTKRVPNRVVPKVKALFDPSGKPYMGALERDCTQSHYKIISACHLKQQPSVDIYNMWG